jgi:hypothetical protein
VLGGPDLRLDRSGIINLASVDRNNGNVYYQTFSTLTNTWGARTLVGTGGETISGGSWPREGQVALTLDANDVPHVVCMTGGTSNLVKYTSKTSGNWSPALTIASGTNEMPPSMVTALDRTIHQAWLDNALAEHHPLYAKYSGGSWSAPQTVNAGDANVLGNGDDDQTPTIATHTNNLPHVMFMDGTVNGSDDCLKIRYRTSAGVWTDNSPPGRAGGASSPSGTMCGHTPQNYIYNRNDEYAILGHDLPNYEPVYAYKLGGPGNPWSSVAAYDPRSSTNPTPGDTCEPGLDGSANARFDPLRDNNAHIVDVIYYDERDNSDCATTTPRCSTRRL